MGNTNSSLQTPKQSFGSISDPGNARPGYYKNKKSIYYNGTIICNDIRTFVKLKHGYANINDKIYYKGKEMEVQPDIQTFEVLNRQQISEPKVKKLNCVVAKDSRAYYCKGKVIILIA